MGGASRFIMLLTTPFPLLHHSRPSFLRLARHSRLCSSFASLSHLSHLNHSSASRLQFVFPVKSSEQFHTQTSCVQEDQFGVSSDPPPASHPWREWSNFIETLSKSRCFEHQRLPEDEFVVYEDMSEEFVRASGACLAFARERWELLGSLSRRDMMVIVENGTPFIFKSALDTARRMRAFLGIGGGNVLESDKAHTVDLMKYLLSYASNPVVSSERSGHYRGELIEVSVRNLLSELCRLSSGVAVTGHPASVQNHFPDGYGQPPMAPQQNIPMKRGDWICARCSFMNFARNSKCLECEEARPKRQLTGGEWECPQCDFFNYGRNAVCLRCDCKRPGETSVSSTSSSPGLGYRNAVSANKPDIDSRLVANEEKAQRWISKISQMDSASDMASAADDEDFPEIMPMRKGVNRFVVSTRKTPLERRLADSQYQRNLSDDGSVPNSNFQAKGGNTPSSRKLDEILGNRPPMSDSVEKNSPDGQNAGTERTRPLSFASPPQNPYPKGSNSTYVPFVPLPNDMFAKNPDTGHEKMGTESTISESSKSATSVNQPGNTIERSGLSVTPSNMVERQDTEKAQADKSGTWLEKIAELHDVNDLSSAVPDDEFPDIMPMRKGENRFVVSKKKDRSLTTPMYKRKSATEQTGSTNFVPFVPFPPDYFTKKDKHPGAADAGSVLKDPSNSEIPEELDENKPGMQKMENNQPPTMNYAADNSSGRNASQTFEPPVGRSSVPNLPTTGYTGTEDGRTRLRENISQQPENSKKFGGGGWSGKSLEGSAVQEPDPLDMSEEAKAQRWFRRVAQIKDISELSDIPDEDFPSIMPMRKGVNRFVVSKRKTPLERRLTSSQYRKSLPVVNSDPFKKENDSS